MPALKIQIKIKPKRHGQILVEFGACISLLGLLSLYFWSVNQMTFVNLLLRTETWIQSRNTLFQAHLRQLPNPLEIWPESWITSTQCFNHGCCHTRTSSLEQKAALSLCLENHQP